jgi:hypothetical protein
MLDRSAGGYHRRKHGCFNSTRMAAFGTCLWFLAISGLAAGSSPEPSGMPVEGSELARGMCAQRPIESLNTTGSLQIRDASGQRTEVPVKFILTIADQGWHTVYETVPSNSAAAIKFEVHHNPPQTNRYFLATNLSPHTTVAPVLPISSHEVWRTFAGSDFWLADLSLEFLHWPQQKVLRTDLRRGRACHVLESRRPPDEPAAYARVLSWVDPGTGGILRAEAYNDANELIKEFSVRSVQRNQVKSIQIRNLKTHSLTRLQFDLDAEPFSSDAP